MPLTLRRSLLALPLCAALSHSRRCTCCASFPSALPLGPCSVLRFHHCPRRVPCCVALFNLFVAPPLVLRSLSLCGAVVVLRGPIFGDALRRCVSGLCCSSWRCLSGPWGSFCGVRRCTSTLAHSFL